MVVEDVGSSQGEFLTQVAGAGERDFCRNPRDVPVEKWQTSEEKARLENPESVRIETACAAADLGVQLSVVCRDLSKAGVNVPCLENVPLSLLMRRMNMWMWLGAVPRWIVIWNLRGSPSESQWAMLSCRNQAGFLILLAFLCVSFFKSHLHSALAFLGRLYILATF